MVHLAQVKNDSEVKTTGGRNKRGSIVPGMEHISLEAPGPDEYSSSVYGSRFASEDLPSHDLPEKEMPKEIAYRMIKDELSLDGNPMLKFVLSLSLSLRALHSNADPFYSLASFVTTYMARFRRDCTQMLGIPS
jgi:glutamate decarboxylase